MPNDPFQNAFPRVFVCLFAALAFPCLAIRVAKGPEYRLEGKVTPATCNPTGEVLVTLSINSVLMKFRGRLQGRGDHSGSKANAATDPCCASWKTPRAKVAFRGNPNGEIDGELATLHYR